MLDRIMNNGVLGLTAQAKALSTVSNNIANANTVGYKTSVSQFENLVLGDRYGNADTGAGVRATDRLRADEQGSITRTGVATNAAISGNGFFIVQSLASRNGTSNAYGAADEVLLTRAGDFQPDSTGQFVNSSGRALMGLKLSGDSEAKVKNVSIDDLEIVSSADINNYQEPTRNVSLAVNLPSDAVVTDAAAPAKTYDVPITLIDKAGVTNADGTTDSRFAELNLRFAKTGETLVDNGDGTTQTVATWTVYKGSGAYTDTGKALTTPPDMTALGTFQLDQEGALYGGESGDNATLNLDLGSAFAPITINLGAYGSGDGVASAPNGVFTVGRASHDGIAAHTAKEVAITDDGYVEATFANGQSRAMYRLVNATVRNSSGLEQVGGNAFRVTNESGDINARTFGAGPRYYAEDKGNYDADHLKEFVGGDLVSASVEGSTTKIEEQFTTLIQAQRTYSAASKMVSTADEMMQTTLQLRA